MDSSSSLVESMRLTYEVYRLKIDENETNHRTCLSKLPWPGQGLSQVSRSGLGGSHP